MIKRILNEDSRYVERADCMAQSLLDNRITDKFYRPQMLNDVDEWKIELEPFLSDTYASCEMTTQEKAKNVWKKTKKFFSSSWQSVWKF